MKQYLLEAFRFNEKANRQMIEKIGGLADREQSVRFISHLINSQNKWLRRIQAYPQDPHLDWWEPVYPYERLAEELEKSTAAWMAFLKSKKEKDLKEEVKFIGFDGGHWAAPLKAIAFQLTYHSFHHRAQIQMLIRQQGLQPDFIDYISTQYRKIS